MSLLWFDPYDPDHLTSGVPFERLAQIRAEQPVCRTPTGSWYVSTRVDVERVFRDIEGFRPDLAQMTGLGDLDGVPDEQLFLSEIEEPRHGQIRRLYNAALGPHRTRTAGPFIRNMCNELLDSLLVDQPADLQTRYALMIPGRAMAYVLDLPASAADRFMEWSADGSLMTRPSTPGMYDGAPPPHAYFVNLLQEQRALPEPTNRVLGKFMTAEIEGSALTDCEIAIQLQFMIMAGVHTTVGLLTHVVERLLLMPDLFQSLKEDDGLIAPFIEESLRHDAPVQRTTRRCERDLELNDVLLREGDRIEVGVASANRDGAALHEDAEGELEEFRLDRRNSREHLSFGAGSHVCPGSTLARLEATIATEVLLDRVAAMSTVPGVDYPPIPGSLGAAPIPAILEASGE